MTILYKLTDKAARTFGETQWGEGVTHTTDGHGNLCGPGWLHAYTDPLLAVLLNPIHGNFADPLLWECEGKIGKRDHGLKVGCTSLTTLRQIPMPAVTTEQRVRFGILCAWEVYAEPAWREWADAWLAGTDRAASAANGAERAAESAAGSAAEWAASAAWWADERAAQWGAERAASRDAARAAEWAAESDAESAEWAASAAESAAGSAERAASAAGSDLDLIALAQRALEVAS